MKLRLRADSVRLRLRQPELRQLLARGSIAESTAFGPGSEFHYRIEIGGDVVCAGFRPGELKVMIPNSQAREWAETEQVGITADQPVGDERTLRILIEKDFACRHGSDESQEGTFEQKES